MGGQESCKLDYDLLCTLLPHTCSKYSNYLTFTKNYTKNNHNVLIIIVPSHVEACASVPSCNPLDLDHIKSCLMTPYWPFYSFHLHIGRGEPARPGHDPGIIKYLGENINICPVRAGDWRLGTTTNGTNVLSVLTGDRAPAADLQLPKPQSNNNQSNKRLTVCVMGGRNEEEDLSWNMMGLWSASRLLRNTFLVFRLQTLPLSPPAQSSIEKREEGAKWSQTVKT